MITNADIERFYEDVKRLDFRFVGKEISDRTKVSKGTVSMYLKGKLPPSEEFLKKFYESFGEKIKALKGVKVTTETPPTPKLQVGDGSKQQSREDLILEEIRHIRKSNDKLIDQQGLMMSQQGTLMETNSKLADKLLSLDAVPNLTVLKEKIMMVEAKENAIFQALSQLMAKVEHKSQKQVDDEMGKLFRTSVEEVFRTGKSPGK